VSASTKHSTSPRAAAAPVAQAHCFPIQPAGSGGFWSTRTRASPGAAARATSAVPSDEWSSTTSTSSAGQRVASTDATQRPTLRASSRAGMTTETSGACAGTAAG
jgi:hypothetical protein